MSSPFSETRFEFDPEHLFFLPEHLLEKLESPHPLYLIGGRGTGKTTLLQSLHWEQRLYNESLQKQLDSKPFAKRYVGVYLKTPEVLMHSLSQWLPGDDEPQEAPVLGLYIDMLWAGAAIHAVASLAANRIIGISPKQETDFVSSFSNHSDTSFLNAIYERENDTLLELKGQIDNARKRLEHMAYAKSPLKEVPESFPILQPGSFGKHIGEMLCQLCQKASPDTNKPWHLKICFDESEVLHPFQQKVVNTAVRLSRWPVIFVFSYVRYREDLSATLFPNLSQQRADRNVLLLDSITDSEFRTLAEGVATLRVRKVLSEPRIRFSLKRVLGQLDINRLLFDTLSQSASNEAHDLIDASVEIGKNQFFTEPTTPDNTQEIEQQTPSSAPPIYETYLIKKLAIQLPDPSSPNWVQRAQSSAELRKRMVAAYLSICNDVNARPKYAFADMVLQLSDHSMRDFLFQLNELYKSSDGDLQRFIRRTIPHSEQSAAIRLASQDKKDSIPRWVKGLPAIVEKYILAFGHLTKILQSEGPRERHLKSSERGRFVLPQEVMSSPRIKAHVDVITDAIESGFLKMISKPGESFCFRVHTSLAPFFGSSYRGAYYEFPISIHDLEEIGKANATQLEHVAAKIAARGQVDLDEGDLFNFSYEED